MVPRYSVYKIVNLVNNKTYIGMTSTNILTRFGRHWFQAKQKKGFAIHNAMSKHGIKNFIIGALEEFESKEEARQFEIEMISKTKGSNSYNIKDGGEGGLHVRDKETWKRNMARARLGKTPFKGFKHSKEAKQKSSEASKKYWDSVYTYPKEVVNMRYKDAYKLYGISRTHYYRLKKESKHE